MITSRPVLNNVYLPQNKLLKRPVFSKMVTILSKKEKKKNNNCPLLQVAYQLFKGNKITG